MPAPSQGVIDLNLDAKIAQNALCHLLVGAVGGERHQSMTAGAAIGHVDESDRCLPTGHDETVVARLLDE